MEDLKNFAKNITKAEGSFFISAQQISNQLLSIACSTGQEVKNIVEFGYHVVFTDERGAIVPIKPEISVGRLGTEIATFTPDSNIRASLGIIFLYSGNVHIGLKFRDTQKTGLVFVRFENIPYRTIFEHESSIKEFFLGNSLELLKALDQFKQTSLF